MKLLYHREIQAVAITKKHVEVIAALEEGNFSRAQVCKLRGAKNFYRAKIDASTRLLFKFGKFKEETCLLLLELINNHAYSKSRFLRGYEARDEDFLPIREERLEIEDQEPINFLNPNYPEFSYLDRAISFDDMQREILYCKAPAIIVGSAGSGKTVLILEKMKQLDGDILYVTHSAHLAENARNLYFAESYENENQNIDFLSFRELLETISVPQGKEAKYEVFGPWFERIKHNFKLKDAHRVFEEIRGVITGSKEDGAYLSRSCREMLIKLCILISSRGQN